MGKNQNALTNADTTAIRNILATIEESVHSVDYENVRDLIPDDGLYFGSVAVQARGYDELREKQFTRVWPNVDQFSMVPESIDIHMAGKLAWATCLFESTAKGVADAASGARKGRMTFVFEQRDAGWVIIHSHDSLYPAPPSSS